MSLRDKIKAADDSKQECVEVPEWDAKVCVRSMSARARARLLREVVDDNGEPKTTDLYAMVSVATCFDPESGEKLFGPEDIGWLGEKNNGPLERLAQVGMRLSGIGQGAVDEGKGDS